MNRPEELIKKIYEEKGNIHDVFLTACGGSLVDLFQDIISLMLNQKQFILIG